MQEKRKYRLSITIAEEQNHRVTQFKRLEEYCRQSMTSMLSEFLDKGMDAKTEELKQRGIELED